jgi:hypothetical protein
MGQLSDPYDDPVHRLYFRLMKTGVVIGLFTFAILSYTAFALGHPFLGLAFAVITVLGLNAVRKARKDGWAWLEYIVLYVLGMMTIIASAVTLAVSPQTASYLGLTTCALCSISAAFSFMNNIRSVE